MATQAEVEAALDAVDPVSGVIVVERRDDGGFRTLATRPRAEVDSTVADVVVLLGMRVKDPRPEFK